MKFLENWLADLLDRFKAKNPKIFAPIAAILTVLNFGVSGTTDPPLLSLEWILSLLDVPAATASTVSEWFTWLFAIALSTSTTAFLTNPDRKEAKIAKSKQVSKEQEAKMAA